MTDQRIRQLQRAAGPVSRETLRALDLYETLFRKWNARINLAAPSTLAHFWERHVVDSAQLLPIGRGARRWLDLGSGGGLPGVVIAILLKDYPGSTAELVESNRKKAAFLAQALYETGAPGRVHALRIADAVGVVRQPDVVTARALAPLSSLFSLAAPWLVTGARALFHKGRGYRLEIEESAQHWSFDLVEHQSIVDPEGVVLEISNLKRRNAA
ncbi:MAG: 16S rRNA (guanine(527)-N(7))-methyltransferase RsmG [Notoacmeibacter sp.]|nr:16S rRNA (guanine(527)-N(7))-methyltransferase RsmG [Notoacmeibacter sp.]